MMIPTDAQILANVDRVKQRMVDVHARTCGRTFERWVEKHGRESFEYEGCQNRQVGFLVGKVK